MRPSTGKARSCTERPGPFWCGVRQGRRCLQQLAQHRCARIGFAVALSWAGVWPDAAPEMVCRECCRSPVLDLVDALVFGHAGGARG